MNSVVRQIGGKSRLIVIVALVLMVAVISVLSVKLERNLIAAFASGPLLKDSNPNNAWQRNEMYQALGQQIVIGGFMFQNHTGLPIKIVSIEPTNVPRDLKVIKVALIKIPQGIGVLRWNTSTRQSHTFLSVPYVLKSSSRKNPTLVQPVVALQTNSPGTYIIQGLLVTYEWAGIQYHDYFRDQFYLTTHSFSQSEEQQIAMPPIHWP